MTAVYNPEQAHKKCLAQLQGRDFVAVDENIPSGKKPRDEVKAVPLSLGPKSDIPQQTAQKRECPPEDEYIGPLSRIGGSPSRDEPAEQADHLAGQLFSQHLAYLAQGGRQREQAERRVRAGGGHHQNRPETGGVAVFPRMSDPLPIRLFACAADR